MKGELKAGGLALIIQSCDKEEIGKTVTLVQLVRPGQFYTAPDGTPSMNHDSNGNGWIVAGDVRPGGDRPWLTGWAQYSPECLMPIDDSDPDAVDQRERDLVAG